MLQEQMAQTLVPVDQTLGQVDCHQGLRAYRIDQISLSRIISTKIVRLNRGKDEMHGIPDYRNEILGSLETRETLGMVEISETVISEMTEKHQGIRVIIGHAEMIGWNVLAT
jgi:hypothetical protein